MKVLHKLIFWTELIGKYPFVLCLPLLQEQKSGVTPQPGQVPEHCHSNLGVNTFGVIMLIALKGQTLKHLLQPVHSSTFPSHAVLIQFSTSRVFR
jgi:hypothetical protein